MVANDEQRFNYTEREVCRCIVRGKHDWNVGKNGAIRMVSLGQLAHFSRRRVRSFVEINMEKDVLLQMMTQIATTVLCRGNG
jgi:hypothetical protein